MNIGMKNNFFDGERDSKRDSFWYGDFEEFVYQFSIKIALE